VRRMNVRVLGAGEVLDAARVELAASAMKMQGFRTWRPFSDYEIAHGFAAFVRLILNVRKPGGEALLQDPSMAAREAALQHVRFDIAETALADQMRTAGVPFDAAREVAWGYARAEHSAWNGSVTRAVVLLCRGLAYRLVEGHPGCEALAYRSTTADLYATVYQLLHDASRVIQTTCTLNGVELLLSAHRDADYSEFQIVQPVATFRCAGATQPPESVDGPAPRCNQPLALPHALGTFAALCPSCGSIQIVLEHADTTLDAVADSHTVGRDTHLYSISAPMRHRAAAWFAHEAEPGAMLVDWMIANTPHMWPHRALRFTNDLPDGNSLTSTSAVLSRGTVAALEDFTSVLEHLEAAARRALVSHQPLLAFALLHRIVTFRPHDHHSYEMYWQVHRSIFRPAA